MSAAAATALYSKTTHVITVESDPESSISRFSIHGDDGSLVWSGITLHGPLETQPGDWSGLPLKSLSAIAQKMWLLEQIKTNKIGKNAVHFSLNIDAQYELPLDTEKYTLTDYSELHVMMWPNETESNDQKKANTRIGAAAGRPTAHIIRMGQDSSPRVVERTCPTESTGFAQGRRGGVGSGLAGVERPAKENEPRNNNE